MKVKLKNVWASSVEEYGGWVVVANDRDGREYTLLTETNVYRVMPLPMAEMVVGKIKAANNKINLEHWSCRTPYGTSAWLLDGMEEREIEDERDGW